VTGLGALVFAGTTTWLVLAVLGVIFLVTLSGVCACVSPTLRKMLATMPRLCGGILARFASLVIFGLLPARRLPRSTRVILFFGSAPMIAFPKQPIVLPSLETGKFNLQPLNWLQ